MVAALCGFVCVCYFTATNGHEAVRLVSGQPLAARIDQAHDYLLYSFRVDQSHNTARFTLAPTQGDPDMYITNDGSVPTSDHYQWADISNTGRGDIRV